MPPSFRRPMTVMSSGGQSSAMMDSHTQPRAEWSDLAERTEAIGFCEG